MAWMSMMASGQVEYHRGSIIERADDHAGRALDYYGSRGETPLEWGGQGAAHLGLEGRVDHESYDAIFGKGGAKDPVTGERLVATRSAPRQGATGKALQGQERPGVELVISASKSVSLLGVLGKADDMHAILDAETAATMTYLEDVALRVGGRRGRDQVRTATHGLTYAKTRHGTSRAGDPDCHDHVLIANLVIMADEKGGPKALDTAGVIRDHLHAATAYGRVASANRAVELGYAVEADHGQSGNLGHWRVVGIPKEMEVLFSKRSAEINEELKGHIESQEERSFRYRARGVAARSTRKAKRHEDLEGDLLPRWGRELVDAGFVVERVAAAIETAGLSRDHLGQLTVQEQATLAEALLAPERSLTNRKVFSRRDVVVAASRDANLWGRDPVELERLVMATLASREAVPLLALNPVNPSTGRAWNGTEPAYATATTLAREQALEAAAEWAVNGQAATGPSPEAVERAVARKQAILGCPLTAGQATAVATVCASGSQLDLVVGVAGSGKTTALDVVRDAYERAGWQVIGTATSGQAARTLGREAHLRPSGTVASIMWQVDHGRLQLDERTVVILDEAGMTSDPDWLRLLTAAQIGGSKVVAVGDHRQLSPVGPGGTFEALQQRWPGAVHVLDENVRQVDTGEREALEQLRSGNVRTAVSWYAGAGRIQVGEDRDEVLDAMVGAWAADIVSGSDAVMFAWKRANVAELNALGRQAMIDAGLVDVSSEVEAPGGLRYGFGDRIVTLAPNREGRLVASQWGVVEAVGVDLAGIPFVVTAMDDGARHTLTGDELAADRIAHGYAVTVHRSQGSTVDVAHHLVDGGGRELAYVAMSRGREANWAYVTADSPEMAVGDLVGEWRQDRREQWLTGNVIPGRAGRTPPVSEAVLRHQLATEWATVQSVMPPDVSDRLADADQSLRRIETDRRWLQRVAEGRIQDLSDAHPYRHGPLAEASADLGVARPAERDAKWTADNVHGRRASRQAEQALIDAQTATRAAEARLATLVAPERDRLDRRVQRATAEREPLIAADTARRQWLAEHPIAERRLERIAADIQTLDVVRDATLQAQQYDRLDWGAPMAQTARERAAEAWHTLQRPEVERERLLARQAEQTIERDFGVGF